MQTIGKEQKPLTFFSMKDAQSRVFVQYSPLLDPWLGTFALWHSRSNLIDLRRQPIVETGADRFTQFKDRLVTDAIIDIQAVSPPVHQASLLENAQVFGYIGLEGIGRRNNLAYGQFSVPQGVEDLEAHGLGQYFEAVGDHLQGSIGEFFFRSCHRQFLDRDFLYC